MMRRTWKQQAFFLGGWMIAAIACLMAWAGGYNLGWLQGYEFKRGQGGPQLASEEVVLLFNEPTADSAADLVPLAQWLAKMERRWSIESL